MVLLYKTRFGERRLCVYGRCSYVTSYLHYELVGRVDWPSIFG